MNEQIQLIKVNLRTFICCFIHQEVDKHISSNPPFQQNVIISVHRTILRSPSDEYGFGMYKLFIQIAALINVLIND